MKNAYRYFVLFIVCYFFACGANAQADTAKANQLQGKLVETICSCISQKDLSSIKSEDDVQSLITNCFMGGDGLSLIIDYAKASGVDISNSDQLSAMGEKIALELSLNCPAMMKVMINVAKDSSQS